MHTGKCLTVNTVNDGDIQEGEEIIQSDYEELDSQKWIIKDSKINGWLISPLLKPDLVISVDGSIKSGAKVILSKNKNEDNQLLYIYNISQEEKRKEDGVYKLVTCIDSSKALEVSQGGKNNDVPVELSSYVGNLQQKFYFEYQEEGYYKITALHTGKSLTIKDEKILEGAEVVQNDYKKLDSQKWIIKDSKINGWLISPLLKPDLAISIDGNLSDSSKIVLSKNKNENNSMFYIYDIKKVEKTKEDGIYKLAVSSDSSMSIEVNGGNQYNNAIVDIEAYFGKLQQKFYLEYQEEGFYIIIAMHTGKCLTVKNNNIKEGTEIVQDDYQGFYSQKWVISDSKINGWKISPLDWPEFSISIEGNAKKGSKIIISRSRNVNNQMFYMNNITQDGKTKENGIYKLAVSVDPGKTLEVSQDAVYNNANIDIGDYKNKDSQKFYFTYEGKGYYRITAMNTGKALTLKNESIQEGTEIVQNDYQGLDSQKWIILDSNINGWIISPYLKPYLIISIEENVKNGAKIVLSKKNNYNSNMFYTYNISKDENTKENGIYKLSSSYDASKVIEVAEGNKSNNATIDLWTYRKFLSTKILFKF